jgi:hypothetical protein
MRCSIFGTKMRLWQYSETHRNNTEITRDTKLGVGIRIKISERIAVGTSSQLKEEE